MTNPRVTCIIPVYNGERYLGEAIESILDQTYHPIEIVVVDDGSTDATATIVAGFGTRVRYLFQTNAGQVSAMNHGVRAASGDLIASLDADDLWIRGKVARQVAHLGEHPETGAVFGHAQNFWIDELREEAERFRNHRIARPLPAYVCGTMMARRQAISAVGPFDVGMVHGWVPEWVLRARAKGVRIDLLPDLLLHRRLHTVNLSRIFADGSRDEFLRLVKENLDRKRES